MIWPPEWDHCHESVERDGHEEPCSRKPVGAVRNNPDGQRDPRGGELYPVCRRHLKP